MAPVSTARYIFGSWNAAIRAAGFGPIAPGQRRDPERHKRNLKGKPGPMASPADVIANEIKKNEERQRRLSEQLKQVDEENRQLREAAKVIGADIPAAKAA